MPNVDYRKVGGLHFVKLGRLTLMFCVSRKFKRLKRERPCLDLVLDTDYVHIASVPKSAGVGRVLQISR